VEYPVLAKGEEAFLVLADNATGAGNQQERLSVESIPAEIGNFLSGFALGEGRFMIMCRPIGSTTEAAGRSLPHSTSLNGTLLR